MVGIKFLEVILKAFLALLSQTNASSVMKEIEAGSFGQNSPIHHDFQCLSLFLKYDLFVELQVLSNAMLLSSLLGFIAVNARPGGAPEEACANIEPMHSPNLRQPGSPLAAVVLSNFPGMMYVPGQNYIVENK